MNAVAVGFIYDLDSMAYETLLSPLMKQRYQARPTRRMRVIDTDATGDSPYHWSLVCALIDLGFMINLYAIQGWQFEVGRPVRNEYWSCSTHIYARSCFFALVHVCGALYTHKGRASSRRNHALEAFGVVMGAVLCLASGLAAWNVHWRLSLSIGAEVPVPNIPSPLTNCLALYETTAECAPSNAMFIDNGWYDDIGYNSSYSYDSGWWGVTG